MNVARQVEILLLEDNAHDWVRLSEPPR